MGEQTDPSDGTPVPVASPVSGASPALAVSPVPRQAAVPGDGRESALLRAREALIAAADALCEAHDYAGAARTLRVALGRWPDGDPGRLAVIDRLARCAELCSEHAAAIELLESLADGYRKSGDVMSLAAVQRRLATA